MICLTGEVKNVLKHVAIFPASHYVVSEGDIWSVRCGDIEEELEAAGEIF